MARVHHLPTTSSRACCSSASRSPRSAPSPAGGGCPARWSFLGQVARGVCRPRCVIGSPSPVAPAGRAARGVRRRLRHRPALPAPVPERPGRRVHPLLLGSGFLRCSSSTPWRARCAGSRSPGCRCWRSTACRSACSPAASTGGLRRHRPRLPPHALPAGAAPGLGLGPGARGGGAERELTGDGSAARCGPAPSPPRRRRPARRGRAARDPHARARGLRARRGQRGDGDIRIRNPMVDLRRDLKRGDDDTLITGEDRRPRPRYLRISVLNRFSDNEWSSGDRDVPSDQVPTAGCRRPSASSARSPARATPTRSTPPRLRLHLAPHPGPDLANRAPPATGATTSPPWTSSPAATTYDRRPRLDDAAVELDLQAEQLAAAPPGSPHGQRGGAAPAARLPDSVRELAQEVTQDVESHFEKAVALQHWFRVDGGFTYDLEDSAEGNGVDDARRLPRPRPRPRRLLRAVRGLDGRHGADPRHPGPGGGRLPPARRRRARTRTSTAPTTCTPGPSSTSTAPAG